MFEFTKVNNYELYHRKMHLFMKTVERLFTVMVSVVGTVQKPRAETTDASKMIPLSNSYCIPFILLERAQ